MENARGVKACMADQHLGNRWCFCVVYSHYISPMVWGVDTKVSCMLPEGAKHLIEQGLPCSSQAITFHTACRLVNSLEHKYSAKYRSVMDVVSFHVETFHVPKRSTYS